MADRQVIVAICFLAVFISCSARPDSVLLRRDGEHMDKSLSNETPDKVSEDVYEHNKADGYNEDELDSNNEADELERRADGLSDQTSEVIANSFQVTQSNPQQLEQLKEILSLEMNNKEKFAEIYSEMTPDQVKKIRELVLKIGQQTNSPELIKFGKCKSPRFNDKQVKVLIDLGEALYERLNTDANIAVSRAASLANQEDPTKVFNRMKASISNQQDFIRRLVNMIEVQLSKAPQIDDAEFAEVKAITEEIKTLSGQIQTQLQQSTDLSQLTQMGDNLLKIQNLSSKLQQKVSAELLEERMKEYVNSYTNNDRATSAGNSAQLQVRDTITTTTDDQTQFEQPKPKFVNDVQRFLGGVKWFFENLQREQQMKEQNMRPSFNDINTPSFSGGVNQQYPETNSLQTGQQNSELNTQTNTNSDASIALQTDQQAQQPSDTVGQLTTDGTNSLQTNANVQENAPNVETASVQTTSA